MCCPAIRRCRRDAQCLADHVTAPPELLRRLKQVVVVDEDEVRRWRSGSGWSPETAGSAAGTGSSRPASGAAAAERLLRANRLPQLAAELPALEQAVADALAERDGALAAMEQCRTAAEDGAPRGAGGRARCARRGPRNRCRDRGARADRSAARQALASAWRISIRSSTPRATPLPRPSSRLRPCPIRPRSSSMSKRRADRGRYRGIGGCRQARRSRDQGARNRRRPRAIKRRSARASRLAQARRRRRAAAWRRRSSGRSSRRPSASNSSASRPSSTPKIAELERANNESQVRIGEAAAAEREAEEAVVAAAQEVSAANERSADTRERRAAAAARAEAQQARSAEFARTSVEKFECVPQRLPEKLGFDADEPRDADEEAATLERLTAERERIGPVNLVAEPNSPSSTKPRTKGAEEAEELTQAIHRLRGSIGNLNREGRVRLLDAYEKVDAHFRRLFTTLFDGGQAHLELVESDDPLEAGLEIMAQPPGKRLSTLTLLSGGEQALTAIALIFAIFLTNPAPICVLDEVDAPLDDANVERFCELLDQMTQETDTRYLIVTHNAVTMSRMHRLYGVTMIEKGVSRLVSVDLGGAETLLAAE